MIARPAAYCRYSSDLQDLSSIEDQLRNIRNYCARAGWPEPRVYSDAEMTGKRADRPGYQAMLAAADAAAFDVLLVDDMNRLSRDEIESRRTVKKLVFLRIRFITVSEGIDTAREGYKIELGMRSIMGEQYLETLAKNVHRNLVGKVEKGFSAGGLSYGYNVVPGPIGRSGLPENNTRAIDPEAAPVVREIYDRFARGDSPRTIAQDLNRRNVRPPRGDSWASTSIYGDIKRQLGILANPAYVGRVIWNRSDWVTHPDTGRRLRRERPESEWMVRDEPELRIVSDAQWSAVQARLRGFRDRTALNRAERGPGARTGGPRRRYILSGILRCSECGRSFQIISQTHYGCPGHRDRGVCSMRAHISRKVAEDVLLERVRDRWLSESAFRVVEAAAREAVKAAAPDAGAIRASLADSQRRRDNLVRAIEQGIVTPSTKAALEAAEAAVAGAQDELEQATRQQPISLIVGLRARWRALVANLGDVADVPAIQEGLSSLFPEGIPVENIEGVPHARLEGGIERAILPVTLVAGGRFESHRTTASDYFELVSLRPATKRARILSR